MKPLTVKVVALPIGNVGDLSLRARTALEEADLIFCEDTRKISELARRADLNLRAKLLPLPGGREHDIDFEKFQLDPQYRSWVLVSDAGSPVVNDPGSELLAFCREHQVAVQAVPGPSAPVLAWQWSGGFGLPFVFSGFSPKAKSASSKELADFFRPARSAGTFVFFETKHQFEVTLGFLAADEHFASAGLHLCREMTKTHEELVRGTAATLLAYLKEREEREESMGELTFVLEGLGEKSTGAATLTEADVLALRTGSVKDASKVAARLSGRPARDFYQLFIQGGGKDD